MERAFKLFANRLDGENRITFEKLKSVAQELGEKITDQELRDMISEADRGPFRPLLSSLTTFLDGKGYVTLKDFIEIMRATT